MGKAIQELEREYQVETYAKYPIVLERGRGAYVYDMEGREYLDFYGGHAVSLTGHSHPHVVKAISEQAKKLLFYSNVVYSPVRAKMLEALVNFAPTGLDKVFLCNSGAEANETALNVALRHTAKPKILAFSNGFHGRTLGALSMTGVEKYRKHPYLTSEVVFAPFGDLASVRELFKLHQGKFAAIILEPIQSMAGVCVASREFYLGLRELCDHTGALLIFDEIQSGLGRTGAAFFGDHFGITPDIITLAKGLASGLPVGAVLFRNEIVAAIKQGDLGSTFGGGPVVCAAALATLEILEEQKLSQNAEVLGRYLARKINDIGHKNIKAVRGMGLLLGIECKQPGKALVEALLELGVLVGSSMDEKVIRLLPALTITLEECDKFLEVFSHGAHKVWS